MTELHAGKESQNEDDSVEDKIIKMLMLTATIPVKLRHFMPKAFTAGIKLTLWLGHSLNCVVCVSVMRRPR